VSQDAELADQLGPHPLGQMVLRLFPKGDVLATYRQEMFERQTRRAELLRAELSASAETAQAVFERLNEDPSAGDLFTEALRIAIESGYEFKIRMLGRIVVDATLSEDSAAIDLGALLVRTVKDLEPLDVRGLMAARRRRVRPGEHGVKDILGVDRAAQEAIFANLVRHGLLHVANEENPEQRYWRVGPYGKLLIRLLERAGVTPDNFEAALAARI